MEAAALTRALALRAGSPTRAARTAPPAAETGAAVTDGPAAGAAVSPPGGREKRGAAENLTAQLALRAGSAGRARPPARPSAAKEDAAPRPAAQVVPRAEVIPRKHREANDISRDQPPAPGPPPAPRTPRQNVAASPDARTKALALRVSSAGKSPTRAATRRVRVGARAVAAQQGRGRSNAATPGDTVRPAPRPLGARAAETIQKTLVPKPEPEPEPEPKPELQPTNANSMVQEAVPPSPSRLHLELVPRSESSTLLSASEDEEWLGDETVGPEVASSHGRTERVRFAETTPRPIVRTESENSEGDDDGAVVLGCLSRDNGIRRAALWLTEFVWFDRLVLILIIVNCVIISMQVPSCSEAGITCKELGHMWRPSLCVGATAVHEEDCVLHGGVWQNAVCQTADGVATAEVTCDLPSVLAGFVRGGDYARELQADTELPFTIAFTAEAATKLLAFGLYKPSNAYLRSSWNLLDAAVVLTSWISILVPGSSNVSVFRVFRVLRPLRTMSRIPGMTTIIATLISAVHSLNDVLIMVVMVFVVFSILAVQFWTELPRLQCESPTEICSAAEIMDEIDVGCICESAGISAPFEQVGENSWGRVKSIPPSSLGSTAFESAVLECTGNPRLEEWFLCDSMGAICFDNFFWTMMTVFQVVTLEGWTGIMYTVSDATEFSVAPVFFVSVVMFAGLFVMQLLLAVITKAYSDEASREKKIERAASQARRLEALTTEVQDCIHNSMPADGEIDVKAAFSMFDLNNDGRIESSEMQAGLEKLLGRKISSRDAARFIDMLDIQADGVLTLDEFMAKVGVRVEAAGPTLWERTVNRCRRADSLQQNYVVSTVDRMMRSNEVSILVLVLIAANTVLLAMEYHDDSLCDGLEDDDGRLHATCMPETLRQFLSTGNLILTCIFAAEMALKLVGMGIVSYMSDPMNRFDGFIVIMSLIELAMAELSAPSEGDDGGLMTIMRAGRLLRIFRSARKWVALRKVMETLMRTLPRVAPLSMLLFLLIVIYALLGMMLFGGKFYFPYREDCAGKVCAIPRANFDDFPTACVVVFQILTGEDWNMIFYDSAATTGMASSLYYVVVVIIGNYIVLSLFVAILLEGFQTDEAAEEQEQETAESAAQAVNDQFSGEDTGPVPTEAHVPSEGSDADGAPDQLGRCEQITQSQVFENIILGAILISSVQLAYQDPIKHGGPNSTTPESQLLALLDLIFLALFTAEFAMKHVALGLVGYWKDGWNQLDGFIVMVGFLSLLADAIPSLKALRGIRALRALRPLRALRRVSGMKVTVNALLAAVPLVAPLGLVSMLFFMVFAILGVQLFAGRYSSCVLEPELGSPSAYDSFKARCQSHESEYIQQFGGASGMPFSNYTLLVDDYESYCQMDWSVHEFECTRRECLLLGGSWEDAPSNFDNVWAALQTLSEMSTTEGWLDVMWAGADTVGVGEVPRRNAQYNAVGFFIVFMVVGRFFVLNLFTSALIDQFLQMQRKGEGIDLLTDAQRAWMESQRKMLSVRIVTPPPRPIQAWRVAVYEVVESKTFEWGIAAVIAINMGFLGTKFRGMEGTTFGTATDIVNLGFTVIFSLEALLKMIAYGPKYFSDSWNLFDLTCVAAAIVDRVFQLGGFATFFRVVRIVRVTRIARGLVQLRQLLETIVTSVIALLNVGSLLFLLLFVYAVLGVALFHSACTVPPPEAQAYDTTVGDVCGDPDRLNFVGFYALNGTEADSAWAQWQLTGEDPLGGWETVCVPGTLQCGAFHFVWQCENVEWISDGNTPHCAGDGDAQGRSYHDCLCEEVNTNVHFRNFGVAMLTLVRFSTGEFWNGVMRDMVAEGHTYALAYFGSFMVLSTLVILNLLVATIVSNHEQAVDASEGAVSSKKNLEDFKFEWEKLEKEHSASTGSPPAPGWIPRKSLRALMEALQPPLGFEESQGASEREHELKTVRETLPSRDDLIQLNETLSQLAGRHKKTQEEELKAGNPQAVEAFEAAQRDLKRKQLEVVNRGYNPADIPEKVLEEVFKVLDSDGSGQLDKDEVAEALKILDLKSVDANSAMQDMDDDGSGEVDFDEFKQWWENIHGVVAKSPGSKPQYKAGSPRGSTPRPGPGPGRTPHP